ncbi:MAG: Fe-Mn family superoxide dismutase [Defluviitaleaceae bacterium]|nr:Fe-Mn family superoxide dismutase [Defluviitaleaceae bacterium]
MDITAFQFPYKTSVVSRKQFDDHMTLYEGYIKMANLTDKTLATQPEYDTANASGGHYRGWKKTETYTINGIILHELYFQNLGSETTSPGKKMQSLTNKFYGGFDKWKEDFTACATSARGWCILAYEQRTASCRNILLDFHDVGQIATAFPLLILDMYEHAYFLDYGTDKASYITRFLENVPWDIVEKRANLLAF